MQNFIFANPFLENQKINCTVVSFIPGCILQPFSPLNPVEILILWFDCYGQIQPHMQSSTEGSLTQSADAKLFLQESPLIWLFLEMCLANLVSLDCFMHIYKNSIHFCGPFSVILIENMILMVISQAMTSFIIETASSKAVVALRFKSYLTIKLWGDPKGSARL